MYERKYVEMEGVGYIVCMFCWSLCGHVQLLNRPRSLYTTSDGGVDSLLRGLSSQSIQSYDRFVTDQVTVHLFAEDPPRGLGTDLVALNIQRGRDHGIPGTMVVLCQNSPMPSMPKTMTVYVTCRHVPLPTLRSSNSHYYIFTDTVCSLYTSWYSVCSFF